MKYKYEISINHKLTTLKGDTYPNCDLFLFCVGGYTWAYTGSKDEVRLELSGMAQRQTIIFSPAALERSEISNEAKGDKAQIKCNLDLEPINSFRALSYNDSMKVIVIRLRNKELEILLFGKAEGVDYDLEKGQATLSVCSMAGVFSSSLPQRTFSAGCTHSLGDFYCGVLKDSYSLTLKLSECQIADNNLWVSHPLLASKPNGYYNGGVCKAGANSAFIISHAGSKIQLLNPFYALRNADISSVKIEIGCDKSIETCKNKFSNSLNYGGFPFVPNINPMLKGF